MGEVERAAVMKAYYESHHVDGMAVMMANDGRGTTDAQLAYGLSASLQDGAASPGR